MLLSHFGISANDLLDIASYANYVMPFVYLSFGAFIGWRIHRYQCSRWARATSVQTIGTEKRKKQ